MLLSPYQQVTCDSLIKNLEIYQFVGLSCRSGFGRSTILENIAINQNGIFLRLGDYFDEIKEWDALKLQEGFCTLILKNLKATDLLIIDDFSTISALFSKSFYAARPNIFNVAMASIVKYVQASKKRIVFGLNCNAIVPSVNQLAKFVNLTSFRPQDYAFFFEQLGGKHLANLDVKTIHKFASQLNVLQIKMVCEHLKSAQSVSIEQVLSVLRSFAMTSNVKKQQVRPADLKDLFGIDLLIRQLEIDIINAFEHPKLADELGISSKRGVLLYGPPGTGKTTIGRALAHRLKSKFFLVDGQNIAGTSGFYRQVQQIFQQAKINAPSILFIDDADLLFENENDTGLYRYLLTMLDGLATKEQEQVTVVLTAMDVNSLPPALIRSGRVELWLEVALPNLQARQAILKNSCQNSQFFQLSDKEKKSLSKQCDEFTGADIKGLVASAKNLYANDVIKKGALNTPVFYLEQVINQLKVNKDRMNALQLVKTKSKTINPLNRRFQEVFPK